MFNCPNNNTFVKMTKIGLISDTHGYFDEQIASYLKDCDEIWHGGDFGPDVHEALISFIQENPTKKIRGVYGNIDGGMIRSYYAENTIFYCEEVKVIIRHIGGYPPKYNKETLPLLHKEKPQLFMSGHSHILKIMYDDKLNCLHMNPGAAGKQGWHKVRTMILFCIDKNDIKDCKVVELGKR
jgi:putative phosphoesterase